MTASPRLERLSRAHLAIALCGAGLVLLAWAGRLFEGTAGDVLFDALYAFNALVIATAVALLVAGWRRWGELPLLVGALAVGCWFLGSFYWTSYVWLAGKVLAYPALDELAFQSFHLLMLILGWHLLGSTAMQFRRPLALVPIAIAAVPTAVHLSTDHLAPTALAFNTVQLGMSGAMGVLGVHLLVTRYRLLGGALVVFTVADLGFHLLTLVETAPIVVFLDPLWFGSHAVISFSLLRYAADGRLPAADRGESPRDDLEERADRAEPVATVAQSGRRSP